MSKLWDRLLRRKQTTPPATAQDHASAGTDDAAPPATAVQTPPLPPPSIAHESEANAHRIISAAPVAAEPPLRQHEPVADTRESHVSELPPTVSTEPFSETPAYVDPLTTEAPQPLAAAAELPSVSVAQVQETLAELALPSALLAESGPHSSEPQVAPDIPSIHSDDSADDAEDDDTDDSAPDDQPPAEPVPTARSRGRTRQRDAEDGEAEGDNWAPRTPPGRPLKRNEVPSAETQLYVWDRDDEGGIVIRMEGCCIGTQWYGPTLYYLVIDWNDRHAPQNSARVVVDAAHLRVALAEKAPRTTRATAAAARKSRHTGEDEHTEQQLEP